MELFSYSPQVKVLRPESLADEILRTYNTLILKTEEVEETAEVAEVAEDLKRSNLEGKPYFNKKYFIFD